MKTLVVGAGATGGYFGARLLEHGRDVTFLVRKRRQAQLASDGLVVTSPLGNITLKSPQTITSESIARPYDLVLLSCKAYDLPEAIESLAPAVGASTAILPILNGMGQLDLLDARFGPERVMGGLCQISSTLDNVGRIVHFNDFSRLFFGERSGGRSARSEAVAAECAGAKFEAIHSETILQDMWEKWVFIAAAAGITCLMRASTGDVYNAGGVEVSRRLREECEAVAAQHGFAPRAAPQQRSIGVLENPKATLMASMLRDIERGSRTEFEHILGNLIRKATSLPEPSLLRIAYLHLASYEVRRSRETGA
jgi:2-dehydropantoate 2-reductase